MKQYQIDRIKDLMEAKGITNQELASKCGISAMTIGRLLTKTDYNPTTDTVEKIAEALGVHEQYIYEIEEESKSKLPINGYIEYGGTISSIKTFKQLEKVYEGIKYDMNVSKLAKELRAKDKQNKKSQIKTEIDITTIDLRRPEEYDTSKVKTWSFLHTDDVRNGISINIGNFSTDHELDICGEHFYHSESAYIVGLFSQNTEESIRIQREVQYEKSPMDAKYTVRARYTKQGKSRKDWDDFKHQWMLYVVWQKCLTNADFAELLRLTPKDVFIIENITNQTNGRKEDDSSDYWGAKNKELEDGHDLIEREVELANPTMAAKELKKLKSIERNKINNVGVWKGINCLGKCLNICKYCLDNGTTPPIDYDLLRSKQIYLFGKLLTFDDEPTIPPTPQKPTKVLQIDDETQKKLKKLGFKSLSELYKARDEILLGEVARTTECERNWLDAKPISWDDFSFRQPHEYDTQKQECWSFNSGKDVRNGINLQLGNMVNGFGVNVLGINFLNSEIPYQLAIFKNNEESINVQKEIIDPKNPTFSNGLAMKRVYIYGKDYAQYRRDRDFELGDKSWCFEWMKWVVWEKVKQNKGFADILLAIPKNAFIIEQAQRKSRTLWGAWNDELLKARKIVITAAELEGKTAKAINNMVYNVNNIGVWEGENSMGQILSMAKLALNEGCPMPIDEQLLNDAQINWFGKVLQFTKDAEGNVTVDAV